MKALSLHRFIGSVVQLVRMPPCHGGGRGFESRPVRKEQLREGLFFCFCQRGDWDAGWRFARFAGTASKGLFVFGWCGGKGRRRSKYGWELDPNWTGREGELEG